MAVIFLYFPFIIYREAPPTHPEERKGIRTRETQDVSSPWMNNIPESVHTLPSYPSSSSTTSGSYHSRRSSNSNSVIPIYNDDILNKSLDEADAAISAAAMVVQNEEGISRSYPFQSTASSTTSQTVSPSSNKNTNEVTGDIISRAMAVISSSRKMFDEGLLRGLEAKGVSIGSRNESSPITSTSSTIQNSRRKSNSSFVETNRQQLTTGSSSNNNTTNDLQIKGTNIPMVMVNGQRIPGPRIGTTTTSPAKPSTVTSSSTATYASSLITSPKKEKVDNDDDIINLLQQVGYSGPTSPGKVTEPYIHNHKSQPPITLSNFLSDPSYNTLLPIETTPSSETIFPGLVTSSTISSVSSNNNNNDMKFGHVNSPSESPTDKQLFSLSPGGESVFSSPSPLKSSPLAKLSNSIGFASRIPNLLSPVSSSSSSNNIATIPSQNEVQTAPSGTSGINEGYNDPILLDALSKLAIPIESRVPTNIRDLFPSLQHEEKPITNTIISLVQDINVNESNVSDISAIDSVNTSMRSMDDNHDKNQGFTSLKPTPASIPVTKELPPVNVAAEMKQLLDKKPIHGSVVEGSSIYVSAERIVLEDPEVTVARLRRRLNAIDDALAPKLAPYLPQYQPISNNSPTTLVTTNNSSGMENVPLKSIESTVYPSFTSRPLADTGSTLPNDQEMHISPHDHSINENNNNVQAPISTIGSPDITTMSIPFTTNNDQHLPMVLLYNPELRAYVPAHHLPKANVVTSGMANHHQNISSLTVSSHVRSENKKESSASNMLSHQQGVMVSNPASYTPTISTSEEIVPTNNPSHAHRRSSHVSHSTKQSKKHKHKSNVTKETDNNNIVTMGFTPTDTLLQRLRGIRENI